MRIRLILALLLLSSLTTSCINECDTKSKLIGAWKGVEYNEELIIRDDDTFQYTVVFKNGVPVTTEGTYTIEGKQAKLITNDKVDKTTIELITDDEITLIFTAGVLASQPLSHLARKK